MNGAQQITWFKDNQNISSSITRGRWLIQIFLTNCCCWTNYTVLKTEPSIQSNICNSKVAKQQTNDYMKMLFSTPKSRALDAQITCSQRPNHVFLTSKSLALNAQITCSQRPNHAFLTSKSRVLDVQIKCHFFNIWSEAKQNMITMFFDVFLTKPTQVSSEITVGSAGSNEKSFRLRRQHLPNKLCLNLKIPIIKIHGANKLVDSRIMKITDATVRWVLLNM